MSPMCQYSAEERAANDWHLQHLGSLSISGAGLVIVEQWRSNRRAASPRYPDGRHHLKIGIGSTANPELPSVPDLRGWFKSAGSADNRRDFQAFVTRLLCIDQAITMEVGNEPTAEAKL
ncbi:MAG TPA: hypothetical protein VGF39_06250 [Stellaceae bacterium]